VKETEMKFKVDENLPVEVAALLRQAGFDASTVLEQTLGGEADSTIAAICRIERRIIVTLDVDFADIRTYPPAHYAGILVLRIKQQDKPFLLKLFPRILHQLRQESIVGKLWIVDEQRIRVRE